LFLMLGKMVFKYYFLSLKTLFLWFNLSRNIKSNSIFTLLPRMFVLWKNYTYWILLRIILSYYIGHMNLKIRVLRSQSKKSGN